MYACVGTNDKTEDSSAVTEFSRLGLDWDATCRDARVAVGTANAVALPYTPVKDASEELSGKLG